MPSMTRRTLLQRAGSLGSVGCALACLEALAQGPQTERLPVFFFGHGSPMNAISDNAFTRAMSGIGASLPQPRAILVVSAHWLTPGRVLVDAQPRPRTIHDFGGFPKALFEVQYPAPGHPELAARTVSALAGVSAEPSSEWGLDHGTWSILRLLRPNADVPVFQVSIDYARGSAHPLDVGRALAALRTQGVLIIASGNIVHNLRATERQAGDAPKATQPWAQAFDDYVRGALEQADTAALASPRLSPSVVNAAVPTPDHYFPLLYALGAAGTDPARTVYEGWQAGTISMRSVRFG